MQSAITRLALFQALAVIYCKFGVGIMLKVSSNYVPPLPPAPLPATLRDYGLFLFLLPAAWIVWASVYAHRPRVGTGSLVPIIISGLALLGFLLVLGFVGTVRAFWDPRPLYLAPE